MPIQERHNARFFKTSEKMAAMYVQRDRDRVNSIRVRVDG